MRTSYGGPLTRRTTRNRTPADRLARLLLEAATTAYVRKDPLHANRGWAETTLLARAGYLAVAEELLRRGVRLPLEDAPEPVQWLSTGRPVFELIDVFAPPVED